MDATLSAALDAIRLAQQQLRWKPGKAEQHLAKRTAKHHVPAGTTLADYERLIQAVLTDPAADLYLYTFGTASYPTAVATVAGQRWLVMVGLDGVMETAFPPDDPDDYLSNPRFAYLGTLEELLP